MQKRDGILYTSAVLTGISSGVALLLAVVYMLTAPLIDKRILAEKEAAIRSLVPDAQNFSSVTFDHIGDVNELFVVETSNGTVYCVNANPKGFGGEINLMVAVDGASQIIGVKVLAHTETAGVGTRIGNEDFLAAFTGVNITSLETDVDVISGATVSSAAVKKGVSAALQAVSVYANTAN